MGTTRPSSSRGPRSEEGVVAVITALAMLAVIGVAAIVLDIAVVRLDRQMNKSATDSAAMAGIEAMRHIDAAGNETGKAAPFAGVCSALAYLQQSSPQYSPISGSLADGLGTPTGGTCPLGVSDPLRLVACDPADRSTWAVFTGSTADGRIDVEIRNGYVASEDATRFPQESLSTLAADQGAPGHAGCDQMAVIITERQPPGFGAVVTNQELETTVRSVARVDMDSDGEVGVALVVLERHDCDALSTNGTTTKIRVDGFQDVPGLIHVDSLGDGDDCTSNQVIAVDGNNPGAIVAGEAELADASGSKGHGVIGSSALLAGVAAKASESLDYVYGEPSPPKYAPEPRDVVTRAPVDDDYFTGVKAAMSQANVEWANVPSTADVVVTNCTGAGLPAAVDPATAGTWYFNCPSTTFSGDISLPNATKVIFAGNLEVRSNRTFAIPKASAVYVNPPSSTTTPGLLIKGAFRMHTHGSATCKAMPTPALRARLVVGRGDIRSEGGSPIFQACDTAVLMMGGQVDGCVPSVSGLEPQDYTACDGTIGLAGGASTDWTAPNRVNRTLADTSTRTAADLADLEDLALWTEAHDQSQIVGSGGITLAGVFALPNADPFDIGGNGTQDVKDSQYLARKLQVRGGGTLYMKPNPYNITRIPYYGGFELVR